MIPSDLSPNGRDWLARKVAELAAQVRELIAGRRMESATIGSGGVTVKGGGSISLEDGGTLRVSDVNQVDYALIGDVSSEIGSGRRGIILRRPGGAWAFAVYGTGQGGDTGFVGLYDRSGNYIVTDDAWSGRGVARPYIGYQLGEITTPTATTSQSTFTDLYSGANAIQHPVMYADLLVRASDGSTAGEVRMAIDGQPVGPTITVPAGQYAFRSIGPFAVTVDEEVYGSLHNVSVQARRTAGSGTIGVRVMSLLGLESAFLP